MSVLFPKVNKMPSWNWRPIYYDPKKDEMDQKLKAYQARRAAEEKAAAEAKRLANENTSEANHLSDESAANFTPSLHRGSFREAHESATSIRQKANRQSKLILWVCILCLLIFTFYVLL